ncbi:MAG: hypothetical protein ACKV2O_24755 [Acidimicrobiales bacterium]
MTDTEDLLRLRLRQLADHVDGDPANPADPAELDEVRTRTSFSATVPRGGGRGRTPLLAAAAVGVVALLLVTIVQLLGPQEAVEVATQVTTTLAVKDEDNQPVGPIDLDPQDVRIVLALPHPRRESEDLLRSATDQAGASALIAAVADGAELPPLSYDMATEVLVAVTTHADCGSFFAWFVAGPGRTLTAALQQPLNAGRMDCFPDPSLVTYVLAIRRRAVDPFFVLQSPPDQSGAQQRLRVELSRTETDLESSPALAQPSNSGDNPPAVALDEPPPITVHGLVGSLEVRAHTTCWRSLAAYCADGFGSDPLPHLGAVDRPIRFDFPINGWTFQASMGPADASSGGPAALWPTGPQSWEIDLTGRAGPSVVQLSGRGPQGDVHMVFAVDLLVAGDEPAPQAELLTFYPDSDTAEGIRANKFGLTAMYLAVDVDPSATVAVIAANGARTQIVLRPGEEGGDPEGDHVIFLESTEADAQAALALGPGPYRFDVALTIAGRLHTATALYPRDMRDDTSGMRLDFNPPLPGR